MFLLGEYLLFILPPHNSNAPVNHTSTEIAESCKWNHIRNSARWQTTSRQSGQNEGALLASKNVSFHRASVTFRIQPPRSRFPKLLNTKVATTLSHKRNKISLFFLKWWNT
eukprot:TRINITY_DN7637_c0_g1_i14.p1 TRINITY_DN7637_c0_g1~~TRINITY_DN7637_c0_g1_i14.p1  ORF type:complete len:111 (-),score=8.09 TRINITY_DN7637_c0_g1_i14:2613-2945(-)